MSSHGGADINLQHQQGSALKLSYTNYIAEMSDAGIPTLGTAKSGTDASG